MVCVARVWQGGCFPTRDGAHAPSPCARAAGDPPAPRRVRGLRCLALCKPPSSIPDPVCGACAGYCWTLVRRVSPSFAAAFHPATDNLRGTAEYAIPDDGPGADGDCASPTGACTWSRPFSPDENDEFLFATGDERAWANVPASVDLFDEAAGLPDANYPLQTRRTSLLNRPLPPVPPLTRSAVAMDSDDTARKRCHMQGRRPRCRATCRDWSARYARRST